VTCATGHAATTAEDGNLIVINWLAGHSIRCFNLDLVSALHSVSLEPFFSSCTPFVKDYRGYDAFSRRDQPTRLSDPDGSS